MAKTKRVNLSLPVETLERLKTQVPEGKRSNFVALALEEKLEKKLNLKESIIRDLKENRHIYEQAVKDWSVLDTEGWPKD